MRIWILSLCMLLASCAGNDCAVSAFELGQRDGVFATYQAGRYTSSCGGSFDTARYTEGFRDSLSRRPPPVGD